MQLHSNMNLKALTIILSLFLFSCQAQESKQEITINFNSVDEQAEAIKKYHQAVLKTTGEERLKNERLFFEAFPNSFKKMQELFGFDDEKGEAPLYAFETGESLINYFSNLPSIDKADYYTKYINICIDGVWEADHIAEGFGFGSKLYSDKDAIGFLKQRSEDEIRIALRFCLDGPHPEDKGSVAMYEELYNKINTVDSAIAKLLKQEYEKLLAEDDGHGH